MNDANPFAAKEWVPHDYQRRGVEWLVTHPAGALFFWPGMGKTSTTLASILQLKAFGYSARTLVLAPLRVAQAVWRNEALKWAEFQHLKIGLAHGPDKEQILYDHKYDIVLLNYEGLQWACPLLLKANPFMILVCDELPKLKHTNTKRFKTIKTILPSFKFRWGLTGTPAANGLLDLFGEIYILDLGQRFGRYITHYRLAYFHQKPYDKWTWHISPNSAERIHAKLADLAMYVDPEEVLKLPPITHIQLPVDLPSAALKQYRLLEQAAIIQLSDSVLTAANAAVLTGKLRQFASGAVYTNAAHEFEVVHTAKLEALEDLVEELAGEPLLLAYNYEHELQRILKIYPNALVLKGGMNGNATNEVLSTWNMGSCPLLCAQADVIAHGLNLQTGGNAIVWFSQTYNMETYTQVIARLYRQGQKKHVRIYHLIANETIDADIQQILGYKDITQMQLFAYLTKSLLAKK